MMTEIAPEINKFSDRDYQKTNRNSNRLYCAFGFCSGISLGAAGFLLALTASFFSAPTTLDRLGFIFLFASFGLLLVGAHFMDKIAEEKKADRRLRFEDSSKR
jgi:hypothetical protein